ncbi:glycosyltransferase family 4 protein [Nostoc sp. 'Peltigera membranacea cyanobiont' 232]|uniref:glycosyltransferase family 4 protein n=1 Tax=Nostoc sp. 'Peltigera membranacea cyanobiont' 232 TaxID=2014531 RepID=UPI000B95452E|nr:glycosyltransferase family 1 protein [Nostoc sp. 'Peltigera membranacea cyanobiont' 232]OYE05960.1 mannosyltransferase [Nostoc sp. 'Peltigera membranacea cyanobiont' 232]
MPILVNLSFAPAQPTGWLSYSLNLLKELKNLDIDVLSPIEISGIRCHQSPPEMTTDFGMKGHLKRLLWTQFKLPNLYRKMKSTLLFSPIPEAPLFSSCSYVVTVHDLIPLRFPQWFSRTQRLYCSYYIRAVIRQSKHVICDSMATAEDLSKFLGVTEDKITVIPLAYDSEKFRFLDLPTQNYFLYLGRHNPHKNSERLITAFAALPNRQDYELWLAGPSDRRYTPVLKAQVEKLGITNQVKFLDYIPDSELPKIINEAIALVFPSLWEGFGLPVLEAMACGTPVITSNLSSLPEVAGDAAILIDPYKIGEITEAMQAIATNSGLRSRLSSQGITHCQQFSWEKTGKATVEVLSRYI